MAIVVGKDITLNIFTDKINHAAYSLPRIISKKIIGILLVVRVTSELLRINEFES